VGRRALAVCFISKGLIEKEKKKEQEQDLGRGLNPTVGEANNKNNKNHNNNKSNNRKTIVSNIYINPTNCETENKAIETKHETALRKTIKFNETKTQQKNKKKTNKRIKKQKERNSL